MSFLKRLLIPALVAAMPAQADTPAPFPEFEAKRVKPPAPGTRKRINVFIEDAPVAAKPLTQSGDEQDAPVVAGRHDWFWEAISPELTSSGPGRLQDALHAIRGAGSVATPRLQHLQEIAGSQGIPILTATVGTKVSPALVLAVISVESAGRADAQSGAGAQGLMQLMPATAKRFGVTDSFEPAENIAGGVKYLDWLMGEFGNDPILVLSAYNAGEGAVRSHDGVPPYSETRDYVPKVLAAFDVARGLCATPPELISDGCVFVTMQN